MLEHRFAQLAAFATFVLLLIGGTVNPTESSLACPEATIICHGQLFPPMTGGVLYEHGHRLFAMTVGMLQIGLTIMLWRRRPTLRWLGVGALFLVIFQGVLGAVTVYYKLPTAVSVAHLMTAMAYFALLIYLAWRTRPMDRPAAQPVAPRLRRWISVATGAVFVQVFIGGIVRHTGGALACADSIPLCRGQFLPSADAPLPLAANMIHRLVGFIVALVVIAASIAILRQVKRSGTLRRLAMAAPVLVALQVALGLWTIVSMRSTPVAVAHFGGAAALWGVWVSMWLIAHDGVAPAHVTGSAPKASHLTDLPEPARA